ncbi:ATP-dependent RNA helicase DDX1-like isoform X1 [Acanthaster planci]|uniref:ATP-dependent RNA helicase n=2 Tax=Acanthaster planci TaxID=133434 RepID=A0A8B7ZYV3_ACAPL|nr:ATP-dependent RNA helicase DDX1-like isoform X1 [Acanthaster planci]
MTAFAEFGCIEELVQAVEDIDWLLPTDVQAEAIPLILGGGDVLMAAETGSGKTGAFCLPVIQIVHESLRDGASGKLEGKIKAKADTSKWQMNVFDRGDAMAIDESGLLCQSREFSWHGTRSNQGVINRGKYYYEATVTDEGLCRVGWSTSNASLDLGTDKNSFGFGGTGKKSFGRQFDSYGEAFGKDDVIGCYLDLDNGTIEYAKNGVYLGHAFDIPQHLLRQPMFAAVVLKNAEMNFNFGATQLKYRLEGGYKPLCKAPEDCVMKSPNSAGQQAISGKAQPNAPKAIILEPSRELAEQTLNQIRLFKKHLNQHSPRELLIIGGMPAKQQIDALQNGIDIVVATPGRIDDLIGTGKLLLNQVQFFILDEADGLLSAGYGQQISRMHEQIPKVTIDGKRLQMIVCSATLHSFEVKKLAEKLMHFPTWVDLKGQDSVPETVHHVVVKVDAISDASWQRKGNKVKTDGVHSNDRIQYGSQSRETLSEAVKILKIDYLLRAINEHNMDRGIIFCRTKLDCDNCEKYMATLGGGPLAPVNHQYSCVCLHGDRKPPERRDNLQKFKDGKVRFLICTDVAARGIDVKGVPYVVNVTLPDEKESYVHRIGRVGRAERMGLAMSFVSAVPEKVWYHSCPSRGRGCYNTDLKEHGGCCIWYNERQYLADIEEHLGVVIDQAEPNMKVAVNEFDGKVVYGQKKINTGSNYKGHVAVLAPSVKELAQLEKQAQTSFLGFSGVQNTLFAA